MVVQEDKNSTSRSHVLIIVRGKDRPGIAMAFMKTLEGHDCQVVDITQFLLEGLLVFTFNLDVGEGSSFKLMKDLRLCADSQGMDLDFHFPDASSASGASVVDPNAEKKAVLAIGSSTSISATALSQVDQILCQSGCVIEEIEHRGDNKIANNGEFNKVQMIVHCPPGCTLATLYWGLINLEGAQVMLRWWDAMNRPHGKSLVVFGLSHVLCPYDVLDELLKEAGEEPSEARRAVEDQEGEAGNDAHTQRKSKVEMLKGKSVKAAQSLIERLEFTKGASLVCSTLKAMGCKLAILTNTGERMVTDHVKQKLGIDYIISQPLAVEDGCFTGEYGGEASDIRFRKLDLLKLMADREGIEYRNVMVVGEVLKGLKPPNARRYLETFGPNVYFNSCKYANLAIVLYQLGFSGSHVQALRQRYEPDAINPADMAMVHSDSNGAETFYVEVSSPMRKAGQLLSVTDSLKPFDANVTIATVRQCSLQNGGMCLGLKLTVQAGYTEQVMKELLYGCQKNQLKVRWEEGSIQRKSSEHDWKNTLRNPHVITIVQQPCISSETLTGLFQALADSQTNVVRMVQLSVRGFKALHISAALPEGVERSQLAERLAEVSTKFGCDIAFQPDDVDRFMRRMIVFDMDSTLIQQEVIDELARIAGVEEEVKAITESAMLGEIDFFGSLKKRVALLKGADSEGLFDEVKKCIRFNPGAERLCSVLQKLGYKMAVISGGFLPVAEEVQRRLGLNYAFANSLEVDEQSGKLTGQTTGPVVTPQRKRALLATISNVEDCKVQQTIAVGDGANDIPMLHTAGLGIAFCAKPKVQAVTEFRINQKDLSTVLFLIGLSEHAVERLSEASEEDKTGAPLVNTDAPDSKKRRMH
jgi:phosphoserine phosphatase SerB